MGATLPPRRFRRSVIHMLSEAGTRGWDTGGMEDVLEAAATPRCASCGTLLHEHPRGWECHTCGTSIRVP